VKELKEELRQRWHESVAELGRWLRSGTRLLQLSCRTGNIASPRCFRLEVTRLWLRALRRRGQKHPMTWARLQPTADHWLPIPKILRPYPNLRFDARHLR
jgi:RNA-directed DNA polymerase